MRHNRGHNTRRLLWQNNWITDTNVALVKDVHGYDWAFVSNLVFEKSMLKSMNEDGMLRRCLEHMM
ncbi:MAG: hypothetical protein AABY14_03445 [Nanoarchaeota archaeon]